MSNTALALESDTTPVKRKPGQRGKELTGSEVADVLRWHSQGLTQQQIADKFVPARSQSAISDVLRRLGVDNVASAKAILRGGAADMALNVVKRGKPKDHVDALKGLGVLDEAQQQGLTVIVGGDATVNIGILADLSRLSPSVSLCKEPVSAERDTI